MALARPFTVATVAIAVVAPGAVPHACCLLWAPTLSLSHWQCDLPNLSQIVANPNEYSCESESYTDDWHTARPPSFCYCVGSIAGHTHIRMSRETACMKAVGARKLVARVSSADTHGCPWRREHLRVGRQVCGGYIYLYTYRLWLQGTRPLRGDHLATCMYDYHSRIMWHCIDSG